MNMETLQLSGFVLAVMADFVSKPEHAAWCIECTVRLALAWRKNAARALRKVGRAHIAAPKSVKAREREHARFGSRTLARRQGGMPRRARSRPAPAGLHPGIRCQARKTLMRKDCVGRKSSGGD
jgi:hypothetical protein